MTRDERGLSDSVQWSFAGVFAVALVLGIIQAAVWFHGRQVTVAAASAAVQVVSARGGSPDVARGAAERVARRSGVRCESVAVRREGGWWRVEVTGRVPVPVGDGRVRAMASAPRERA